MADEAEIGHGDAVWELFGHNAIWIKDRSDGSDITYNWGMFDFNQPNFLGRFLTGNTSYWMEGIDLESMLQSYTERNRSLLAQELNREANTLASKSASQPISDCALELKLLIEQVREQVQNIE